MEKFGLENLVIQLILWQPANITRKSIHNAFSEQKKSSMIMPVTLWLKKLLKPMVPPVQSEKANTAVQSISPNYLVILILNMELMTHFIDF